MMDLLVKPFVEYFGRNHQLFPPPRLERIVVVPEFRPSPLAHGLVIMLRWEMLRRERVGLDSVVVEKRVRRRLFPFVGKPIRQCPVSNSNPRPFPKMTPRNAARRGSPFDEVAKAL